MASAAVGDDLERLVTALRHHLVEADVVELSGGLGPTVDDLTRNAVRGTYGCSYPDAAGLTRREREACLDRPTKEAKVIDAPMSAGKRSAFDRVAAKQRRDREWRENPTMPSGTSEEQGPGRPAGVGPANPVHAPIRTPF